MSCKFGEDPLARLARAHERDRFHDECGVFSVQGHPEAVGKNLGPSRNITIIYK